MTKKEMQIGGRTLSLETGAVARQANGACVIRYGDTVVLATACFKEGTVLGDFMPLTVDYKEYTYAGGRIPGGFFKREGRPTEKEILTSRLIDRPLRPSFVEGYKQETQIIALVLSADGENDPDIFAINAASASLVVSEIPFLNPISAVRVGYLDGQIIINPTNSARAKSTRASCSTRSMPRTARSSRSARCRTRFAPKQASRRSQSQSRRGTPTNCCKT